MPSVGMNRARAVAPAFDALIGGGMDVGTHRLVLAQVHAVHLSGEVMEPALWFGRGFRALAPAEAPGAA
jgi:flavin reductase (DIM6/NTAB) family NADH-FMN oxidoreductase RutF